MTTLRRYLEMRLAEATKSTKLKDHVAAKRGDDWTWQQIADDLHDTTGVTVSRETLRLWFPEPAFLCADRFARCERLVEQDGDYCPVHDVIEPDWDAIRKDREIDERCV